MTRFGLSPPSGVAYVALLTLVCGLVVARALATVHPALGYGAAALILFVVAVSVAILWSIEREVGLRG